MGGPQSSLYLMQNHSQLTPNPSPSNASPNVSHESIQYSRAISSQAVSSSSSSASTGAGVGGGVVGVAIDTETTNNTSNQSPSSYLFNAAGAMSPNSVLGPHEHEVGLLACEALALDTLIATIRTASQTTSTLDETFMENYVFNHGCLFVRFGVFVEPKVDNRPQFMTIVCDQIGIRNGEINNAKNSIRDTVKARIAEVRDDVISEVPLKIGPGVDIQSKQLYSKPGRRSGKRREEVDGSLPSGQQVEFQKRLAEKDAMRDIVQVRLSVCLFVWLFVCLFVCLFV